MTVQFSFFKFLNSMCFSFPSFVMIYSVFLSWLLWLLWWLRFVSYQGELRLVVDSGPVRLLSVCNEWMSKNCVDLEAKIVNVFLKSGGRSDGYLSLNRRRVTVATKSWLHAGHEGRDQRDRRKIKGTAPRWPGVEWVGGGVLRNVCLWRGEETSSWKENH